MGPDRFRRHRAEALPARTRRCASMRIPSLAYDVDWPADVAELSP